jgi:RNA polymerase sigma-70 factor, ECF subfamily
MLRSLFTVPSVARDAPAPQPTGEAAPLAGAREAREARAVERLARGDVDALGDLYDLHHAAVRSFARRYLGDEQAAEDLVHDTFLALSEAASKVRGSSVKSYLIGIAVNLSRHHLRSARRRREALSRLTHEPLAEGATPEQSLAREQLAGELQRALDQLSHEHRAAFVLCEIEERSGPEIAAILGIPEATVRTRLFHAKRRLREALEGAR